MRRRKRGWRWSDHELLKCALIGAGITAVWSLLLSTSGCLLCGIPALLLAGILQIRNDYVFTDAGPANVPLYVILTTLSTAIPGAVVGAIIGRVRERRRRRHRYTRSGPPLCASCGYNLTANVSGVCPECGTSIRKPDAVIRVQERPWRWADRRILNCTIAGGFLGLALAAYVSLAGVLGCYPLATATANAPGDFFFAYLGRAALCVLAGVVIGAVVGLLWEAWRR